MYAEKNASRKRMPPMIHGSRNAAISVCRRVRETAPISFMPRESIESPIAANTATPASTRYLRNVTVNLGFGRFRRGCRLVFLPHPLVAHGSSLQESFCFLVKTLPFGTVESCLAQDTERGLGPEIVLIVEAMHHFHHFFGGQIRILNLHHLMSTLVHHLGIRHQESILHDVIVELGAWVRMGHRNLDRFDVEFLGKVNGVADGLASLARQSEDEVAVNHQAKLVAVLGELPCAFHGR